MQTRIARAAAIFVFCAQTAAAATFTVNTTADSPDAIPGDGICLTASASCSLRAAIEEANTSAALDTIAFALPGSGVRTIRPLLLPAVAQPVVIDGFTQPGSQPNTVVRDGIDAVLLVEVDLSLAGSVVFDGGNSTVRGLVVNLGGWGLWFRTGTGYAVEGCFIGTDATGMFPRGNSVGVRLETSSNRIGGLDPSQRNLISGNGTGILLPCPHSGSCHADTVILNSYIGTNAPLTAAVPNGVGIDGTNTSGLVIGGAAPEAMNVISGNSGDAIQLQGRGPTHNSVVEGNRIGVGRVGQTAQPLPNGERGLRLQMFCIGPPCIDPLFSVVRNHIANNRDGIWIDGGEVAISDNFIANNTMTGIDVALLIPTRGAIADNTISRNGSAGLRVGGGALTVSRNVIVENGLADGSAGVVVIGTADRVALSANRMWDNAGLGIDLLGNGVTPNDPGDGDVGPNRLQNFPVISAAACTAGGSVAVSGSLNTQPNLAATIELFRSAACDGSGHGEGAEPRASVSATTDSLGNASFNASIVGAPGDWITATATANDRTSELSACVQVAAGPPPPPQSISGPTFVCAGSPFQLRAVAGAGAYQWFLNGSPIPGATSIVYGKAAGSAADAGSYTVRASNCGFDATSPLFLFSVVTCSAFPVRMDVDRHAAGGTASDLNGILEPSESVLLEPRYRNATAAALTLTGSASFTGPAGPAYSLPDATASYGTVTPGQLTDCFGTTGDCYRATVSGARPQTHWDATFTEFTSAGDPPRWWPVHVGDTFLDVPRAHTFYRFVETLVHNSVTTGCGVTAYCPDASTTREQMAVFVLVAKEGPSYGPPPCAAASPRFADVPAASPYCRWVEELARRGVIAGCTATHYCPAASVSREQMAVFVLATREAPGYTPPACVAGSEVFADVPASSPFCRWIEELARRSVVAGCGGGNYCPALPVTRGEMSVFIGATFGLLLYGP